MDVKYTFRDIIVYLLTGFMTVLILLFSFPNFFDDLLMTFHPDDNKCIYSVCSYLQSHETIAVIVAIPSLYVVGHMVQVFDLVLSFYCARFLKRYRYTKILYKLAGSTTVEYQRTLQKVKESDFIAQEYTVRVKDKYATVEYNYLLKELFNGLRTFLIIFFVVSLFLLISGAISFKLLLFNFCLLILCWAKAKNSATNYVWGIRNTYDAIQRDTGNTSEKK